MGKNNIYSLLQTQAKCYDVSKYEYNSWGGSFVDDFMVLATDFSMLTFWSLVLPVVSAICFVAQVVTYRLMAYRFVNVTCRPPPFGTDGIGAWGWIFEKISIFAMLVNVCYLTFVMYPVRSFNLLHGIEVFVGAEHLMLVLMFLVAAVIPDEPNDVRRIEDFNTDNLSKLARHRLETSVKQRQSRILASEEIRMAPEIHSWELLEGEGSE